MTTKLAIENLTNLRDFVIDNCDEELTMAIKALEKQMPLRPDIYDDDCRADCPNCEHEFENNVNDWACAFCPKCGQALDWS